ncbi:MAG: hypothetical protein IJD43_14455 [Thermoguttaceae bacterium]|nr:hypothetical protein [Thermoguttaceae bacterium]
MAKTDFLILPDFAKKNRGEGHFLKKTVRKRYELVKVWWKLVEVGGSWWKLVEVWWKLVEVGGSW